VVSIPRLEFWPFVLLGGTMELKLYNCFNSPVGILAVCASLRLAPRVKVLAFQFPGWNSGRLCAGQRRQGRGREPVSIPRLEFWPFVRRATPAGPRPGTRFNSPVGILAVCASIRLLSALSCRWFQFPGWNSGRLCAHCRSGAGGDHRVSIPRLEFWPFVLLRRG